MFKKNILLIAIYLCGMLSFFLVDFLVARFDSLESIAQWASLKSIVMIGATACLLGMDQVMVRLPNNAEKILKRTLFQLVLLVSIYSVIMFLLGLLADGIVSSLAIFSLALATLLFGFFRSQFLLLPAQLVTNLWKVIFLVILAGSLFFSSSANYPLIFVVSISITIAVVLPFVKFHQDAKTHPSSIENEYGLGFRFFLSLITLNLSIYLEQVLLNLGGHTGASAIYFSHFAILLPVIISFNGFVGFLLGPIVRRDSNSFDSLLIRYWWALPLIAIFLCVMSYIFSMWFYEALLGESTDFDPILAFIIVVIGGLRVLYILPSGYLSVLATTKQLSKFVLVNVFGIFVLVAGYFVFYSLSKNAIYSIALASLLNWSLRAFYGNYLVWIVFNIRRQPQAVISQ